MTLLDEANALRQSILELAGDEAAGGAQVEVLVDAARSPGHQWARTPGDRPGFARMLTCLGAWLDLEHAAAQERGEALDAMLSTQAHPAEGAASDVKQAARWRPV